MLRLPVLFGLLLSLTLVPSLSVANGADFDASENAINQTGRWVALAEDADFSSGAAPELLLETTEVSPAGGGTLWYELTFRLSEEEPIVLDFASSSTLNHFVHYILGADGTLVAEVEGGMSQPAAYEFFLRHGRQLELPAGDYRVITRMQSPFFLALPEPRVFRAAEYQREIPYTQSLTLIGLGIFMGLLFYYAVMALWRRSGTDGLYALFILGNLLYNGSALMVYNHLFNWTWFYLISTPILFSNAVYIGFVIRLLGITRAQQPVLFGLGIVLLGVLMMFWPLALIWPNWSMEFCRAGVGIFALYGLLCGIVRSLQGSKVARLYLFANAAFAVPALFAISLKSMSNPIYLVEHLGMVAVLVEVLLLAQVMSYQVGQVYKERAAGQGIAMRGQLLDNLTAQAPGVIYQLEMAPDGRISAPFASRRLEDYFELSPEDVLEDTAPIFDRVHPDDYNDLMASIIHSARHLTTWRSEFRVLLPEKGLSWLEGNAQPERLQDNTTRWYGFISDVTERKLLQEHMHHMAQHDPLTNLPNRALFRDRLAHALDRARRSRVKVALMFVDVDNFKTINDEYGHDVGDELLRQISQALTVNLRNDDTVARLGGDEFVVLLETVTSEREAMVVAEKIRRSCDAPMPVGEYSMHISISIGIALFPDHADDDVALVRAADLAMYRAKQAGRNRIIISGSNDEDGEKG